MTVEAAAATSRRWRWRPWAGAALAVTLLALVYHRTAAVLWRTWHGNDNYSHGPLVPLVSLTLAWLARDRWRTAPSIPDKRGLILVALACLLQVAGVRSDIFALECYSVVVMAFGLCLTFQGPARTRVMAFPLGFLVFMMVFPPLVVVNLSYALKEFTVAVAVRLAEACGVILQRSGMTIFLTDGRIRIENPCSGLRSLVALLATGAVFAYLQPGGWWRRAALCLAAIPLAMLGNALRITLILLVGHYASVKQATGTFHDRSGYVVYCLALLGLVLIRRLLAPRARPEPVPA
jgi:exosortase